MKLFSKANLKSELVKSAVLLSSGTVIAQGISYTLMPFITRVYTPEDFGEYGIMMRIVAFLAVLGAARYEYAIPLPKRDKDAFHIYRLTIKILVWVVLSTFLSGLFYWAFEGFSYRILVYVVMVVGITGFTVFINIGRHWAIRTKGFRKITVSNLFTSAFTNVGKLITGLMSMGVFGLLISTLIGLAIGSYLYVKDGLLNYSSKVFQKSEMRLKVLARQYDEFPKVNLPQAIVDVVRDLIVAFLLTSFLSTSLFGSYDHSYRMLRIPLLLVGVSIGQVLYNRLSEEFANGKSIYPLLRNAVILLILMGIFPFAVIYFFGTPIFSFVFGEQWEESGRIASAIAPWLMANFVLSTISIVPNIIGKLKWFLGVALVISILQVGEFALLPRMMTHFQWTEIQVISFISWSMFALFFVVIVWMLKMVKAMDD